VVAAVVGAGVEVTVLGAGVTVVVGAGVEVICSAPVGGTVWQMGAPVLISKPPELGAVVLTVQLCAGQVKVEPTAPAVLWSSCELNQLVESTMQVYCEGVKHARPHA